MTSIDFCQKENGGVKEVGGKLADFYAATIQNIANGSSTEKTDPIQGKTAFSECFDHFFRVVCRCDQNSIKIQAIKIGYGLYDVTGPSFSCFNGIDNGNYVEIRFFQCEQGDLTHLPCPVKHNSAESFIFDSRIKSFQTTTNCFEGLIGTRNIFICKLGLFGGAQRCQYISDSLSGQCLYRTIPFINEPFNKSIDQPQGNVERIGKFALGPRTIFGNHFKHEERL
ncbi:hypothetical protein DESC_290101 [Desulfosarcina cetonica]|nr:hypothetical protein DESC_290101 [Desulfosarcina cetonica]